jgi:hypothetical protein
MARLKLAQVLNIRKAQRQCAILDNCSLPCIVGTRMSPFEIKAEKNVTPELSWHTTSFFKGIDRSFELSGEIRLI